MKVEIVTIGDELLLGFTIDTNAAHLARALASIGVGISRRTTCGDTAEEIADAVSGALERAGAVITTGGLGPTSDDLTKPSIAALFGREMVLDEDHLAWMQERWRTRFKRPMPESNRQQALLPAGAEKLRNDHGSAPGIWMEDERGRWVAMLPGVPREMRGLLADHLLPRLRTLVGNDAHIIQSRTLRTTGIGESAIADRILTIAGGVPDAALAYLPNADGTDLRLTVRGDTAVRSTQRLQVAVRAIESVVQEYIYGEDGADLASVVLQACREAGVTLAVAESCTGGLLGARLTAIPGSSDVVIGGVIAYADEMKATLLGVPADIVRAHGAVSEPVAAAMATGVRQRTNARLALAITGIAGPGGGSSAKPVGTVWVALDDGDTQEVRCLSLVGDRAEIRHRAAQAALEMTRRHLLNLHSSAPR